MISVKEIVNKTNQKISEGNLTPLEISQISGIDEFLTNATSEESGDRVSTFADLPDPVENIGRMIYVIDEEEYYFSDGSEWTTDFSSEEETIDILYAWGRSNNGLLGDNTTISRSSPVTVVGGITNWSQVNAGEFHTLGLTDTGILYAWGQGSYGRLGDGTNIARSSPVTVIGGITNWSQIGAGNIHSLGLTNTGILYAWGRGTNGQLGDGTTISRSSPVTVIGGITNWSQISVGGFHSLGLTSTGILYAWGNGANGRLGDGTTIYRSSPVTVIGGITNWSGVSAGIQHSLGLTSTGTLYAWGYGSYGRLGDGTTIYRSSPVTVIGGITNWSQIGAGNQHTLGLTNTGILYAWGSNSSFFGAGRLGDGTTISRSSPVTVVGGITNWSEISAGSFHNLGLTSDGIIYTWGSNSSILGAGALGDGTAISRSSPVTVVGGITNWSGVFAGNAHSMAISSTVIKGF